MYEKRENGMKTLKLKYCFQVRIESETIGTIIFIEP